jgi:tetratricopeptide (TPR) repeat protein
MKPFQTASLRHSAYYLDLLGKADDLYRRGGDDLSRGLALFDGELPNIRHGWDWAIGVTNENEKAAEHCIKYSDFGASIFDLRQHPLERIRHLEAALAAAKRLHRRDYESVHLGNLGSAYTALGDPRRAISYHEAALKIDREIGNRSSISADLGNLGNCHFTLGDPRRAVECYEEALAISREIKDRRAEATDLGNLGRAHAALGETRRAVECYEARLRIVQEIGDTIAEYRTLGSLGLAHYGAGDRMP